MRGFSSLKPYGTALFLTLAACGSGGKGSSNAPNPNAAPVTALPQTGTGTPADVAAQLTEKPWEVISKKGETYLPNVFYADASENEQVMPWALDGHTMIDRLVYPTLGNPNLYSKGDATDELAVVLRIEDAAYDFLGIQPQAVAGQLSTLPLVPDAKTGFAFFLVARAGRDASTEVNHAISSGDGTNVYRVYPREARVNPIPADMPERLKGRKTVRFLFDQAAMTNVPPGLYDVRFEVRKDDDLYKGTFEYQYNAVRVFATEPDEYKVINVTDTQVSVGALYSESTKDKLSEFATYVTTSSDPQVRDAAFITFNGDLHNGGSPGSLTQRTVATTYNDEAKAIVGILKYLNVPIFLTVGNHDGYVSTGQVPSAVIAADTLQGDSLQKVTDDASPKAWPNFLFSDFQKYIDATAAADVLGGWHRDVFTGAFARRPGTTFADSWQEVPTEQRNMVLYDGFHQWQKTYGPLYYSHKFGKSSYVSMNSFELRQHRRSGWGMYTVNYGGGMSAVQMAWIDRELLRAKTDGNEVTLLAHHDPRGGHKGEDLGYFFDLLEFKSVYQSAINYLVGKIWTSGVCSLPDWAIPRSSEESCVHDGLQEWMRPDEDFDCTWDEHGSDGRCDATLFDPALGDKAHAFWFSGLELTKRFAGNPAIRTVLLGHTHYNSLEVLETGDALVPGQLQVDGAAATELATLEIQNPLRGFAMQQTTAPADDYLHQTLPFAPIAARTQRFAQLYRNAVPAMRFLDSTDAKPRELVVLRLVSNADLANQTILSGGNSAMGFAVLQIMTKGAYPLPQIDRLTFFVNSGSNVFSNVRTIDIDRATKLAPHDAENPLQQIFNW